MPLKLEPPFGPVVGLFPPKSVNQTICAVWNGDKSRFLSLCYRLAAPGCCPQLSPNACCVQKTLADQLVLHHRRHRFYCSNASATGRRSGCLRARHAPRRPSDAAGWSWVPAIRVAADTRTAAPVASRAARPRRSWPNTRAGHAGGNLPRQEQALPPRCGSRPSDSALLARFLPRVAGASDGSCGGPSWMNTSPGARRPCSRVVWSASASRSPPMSSMASLSRLRKSSDPLPWAAARSRLRLELRRRASAAASATCPRRRWRRAPCRPTPRRRWRRR